MLDFQKIIDKISEAFSILDFSYIISGSLTFLLILFDMHMHHEDFMMENMTLTVVCGIFLSYICGLISWIIGKSIRRILFLLRGSSLEADFREIYEQTVKSIGDTNHSQLSPIVNYSFAYEYMWICLGTIPESHDRVNYIHRFWVMQAVYEGLICSFLVAFGVLIDIWIMQKEEFIPCPIFLFFIVLILIIVYLCIEEARRCARVQISEVILSYYVYVLKKN